jgi:hypothetical protein
MDNSSEVLIFSITPSIELLTSHTFKCLASWLVPETLEAGNMLLQYLHRPCIKNPPMYIGSASFQIIDLNLRGLCLEPASMEVQSYQSPAY